MWIDVVILLIIASGFIRGLMRGLISEVLAVATVALGVLGTRLWAGRLANWLLQTYAWGEMPCRIVSYLALFLLIAIVLSMAGMLLKRLLKAIHLGWLNRLLGGVCGMLKWGILVVLAVAFVHYLDVQWHLIPDNTVLSESQLYPAVCQLLSYIP